MPYNLRIMKAVLYVILILVIAAGACALTCPDREDHVNALENVLQRTIDKELSGTSDFKDDPLVSFYGSALLSGVFGSFIDSMLMVDNYFIFSIGSISYGGEIRTVSVGVFNHVFTASADQLAEEAVDALK